MYYINVLKFHKSITADSSKILLQTFCLSVMSTQNHHNNILHYLYCF